MISHKKPAFAGFLCDIPEGEVVLRFIHTADWHLGRLFHGQHLTGEQSYLLDDFLRMVTDSRAEAVLIAGDIYDRAVPPTEAVELFDEVLARLLLEKKVQVFFIAGNHDSAQRLGFASRILDKQGLFVRGQLETDLQPFILQDQFGPVYFQLYPYMEPALVRAVFGREELMDFDTATGYVIAAGRKKIPARARCVAVAHAFIAGGQTTESERPLLVGGSSNVSPEYFRGYSYTALGHLHNPQQAGAASIRYSGSLMKYSFAEADQQKGLSVVELDGAGSTNVEFLPLVPKHDVCRVRGYFDEILSDRERYPKTEDYMLVELLDTEAILDVHGKLADVYPNLMQIDRPNLNRGGELKAPDHLRRNKSEAELFRDFFTEMTGEAMNAEQDKVLMESMEEIFRAMREGKA